MKAALAGKIKTGALLATAGIATAVIHALGPLPQNAAYHVFADERTILGLPNALNAASNVFFIVAGAAGAFLTIRRLFRGGFDALPTAYLFFFFGICGTGFGSFYYHLAPSNQSLFWDRLPMSIAFMSFFAAVITERVNRRAGSTLLLPLIALGVGSVLYWARTEALGRGDLRPYAAVQFVPLLLIAVVLLAYRSPRSYRVPVLLLLACYLIAKVCEALDAEIYSTGHIVSGHTLKHLFAALGACFIVNMLRERERDDSRRPALHAALDKP